MIYLKVGAKDETVLIFSVTGFIVLQFLFSLTRTCSNSTSGKSKSEKI